MTRIHSGRVNGVVGANDQDNVSVGEVVIDLVHLHDDVVGDVGFGEQHIHAAMDPGTPISGMPVLHVWEGHEVVVFKRSMKPGYAGVENPL
jgi:hypothetical protein